MPVPFYVHEYKDKIDSLYRLVIIAAKRVNQIAKMERHAFGKKKKPTVTSVEEFEQDKLTYRKNEKEDLSKI